MQTRDPINRNSHCESPVKKQGFTPSERKRNTRSNPSFLTGFTLIEMLVVLTMFSLIGLAIFTTLANGINIWQRMNQTVKQDDINIFFDRIAGELRNTFEFSTIGFQGNQDKIAFVTLVTTEGPGGFYETGIGQVAYFYIKGDEQLNKRVRSYSQTFEGDSGNNQTLLDDVRSLEFAYYFYDQKAKEYLWQEECIGEGLPLAVRIKLELRSDQQIEMIIRTIDIPVRQS
ncbi:MAG: type II secretion system protein GspJ [Candidatus Omnitrophota bacterium]